MRLLTRRNAAREHQSSDRNKPEGSAFQQLRHEKRFIALSAISGPAWGVVMQVFACISSDLRLSAPMIDTDLVFKALADPTRRKLLDLLNANNGQTLTGLCEHLDMTRQAATQHLSILAAANLVATTWRGREKLHFLNPVPLQEIYDRWICKFERSRLKAMRDLKRRLEGTYDGQVDVCLRDLHRRPT